MRFRGYSEEYFNMLTYFKTKKHVEDAQSYRDNTHWHMMKNTINITTGIRYKMFVDDLRAELYAINIQLAKDDIYLESCLKKHFGVSLENVILWK